MTGPHPKVEKYRPTLTKLAARGKTLQELGDAIGMSRERARQLLHRFDLYEDWKALRRAEQAKKEEQRARHRRVQKLINQAHYEKFRLNYPSPGRMTEQFMLDCLVDAYEATGGYLSVIRYDEWRVKTGKQAPCVPRYMQVFGSWSAACERAGVQPGKARRSYTKTYSDQQCWDAIERVCQLLNGKLPSWEDYVRYRLPTDPSPATIRNRLGGWSAVLRNLRARGVA